MELRRPEQANAIDPPPSTPWPRPTTARTTTRRSASSSCRRRGRLLRRAGSPGISCRSCRPAVQLRRPRRINPFGTTTRLSKPLVVALQGTVGSMANELLLAADIRVAAEDTVFHQGEVSRGTSPAGGQHPTASRDRMGQRDALDAHGESWDAAEALRVGLVQEVVPAGRQFAGRWSSPRRSPRIPPGRSPDPGMPARRGGSRAPPLRGAVADVYDLMAARTSPSGWRRCGRDESPPTSAAKQAHEAGVPLASSSASRPKRPSSSIRAAPPVAAAGGHRQHRNPGDGPGAVLRVIVGNTGTSRRSARSFRPPRWGGGTGTLGAMSRCTPVSSSSGRRHGAAPSPPRLLVRRGRDRLTDHHPRQPAHVRRGDLLHQVGEVRSRHRRPAQLARREVARPRRGPAPALDRFRSRVVGHLDVDQSAPLAARLECRGTLGTCGPGRRICCGERRGPAGRAGPASASRTITPSTGGRRRRCAVDSHGVTGPREVHDPVARVAAGRRARSRPPRRTTRGW